MTIQSDHIIQRLVLHLDANGPKEEVYALQNSLKECIKASITKQLDPIFSDVVSSDEVLRIPKLEVDLGVLQRHQIPNLFEQRCLSAIKDKLEETRSSPRLETLMGGTAFSQKNQARAARISRSDSLYQQWLYFLQSGQLPWWKKSWSAWESVLEVEIQKRDGHRIWQDLNVCIQATPKALDRLLWQFSNSFLQIVAKQTLIQSSQHDSVELAEVSVQQQLGQALVKGSYTQISNQKDHSFKLVQTNTQKKVHHLSDPELDQEMEKIKAPTPISPEQTWSETAHIEGAYFITNAGLALILPCLYALFKQLEYLKESGHFISFEHQVRAVQLIQFMANGQEESPEHLLALNKLTCGIPLDEPIPRFITLSTKEKEAGELFLKAIIEHIPKLKNTSIDGLRQNFLQREGKLSEKNGGWLLKVNPIAYDPFLLRDLAWGLSMVKFRWMKQRIDVEWI